MSRCQWESFPTDWRNFPKLRQRRDIGGKEAWSAACPIEGGDDRISIYPLGNPKDSGAWRFDNLTLDHGYLICRNCGLFKWLDGKPEGDGERRELPTAKLLPMEPDVRQRVEGYASCLTTGALDYLVRGRRIHPRLVSWHLLGWRPDWHRVSIPTWLTDDETGLTDLYNVQYRLLPRDEQWKREHDREVKRYVSEPDSRHVLFNADVRLESPEIVVLLEGRFDALTLTSLGFPACAASSWDPAFNKWVTAPTVVIIGDNDGGTGELKAIDKHDKLGRGTVFMPPEGVKDAGQLVASYRHSEEAIAFIAGWLKVPPVMPNLWREPKKLE